MLGAAPQQKDQMHRVDRVHLALVDPGLEHRRAATEPLLIVLVEVLGQALATADHFHGEDFRRQRLAPGELHLGADITGQGGGRIVLGAQVAGALNEFPASVVWYLFSEGTFLFLDGGTLDLGLVRDSTLNGTNDYKIFLETFEGVAKVGLESLKVTSPVNLWGATAATVDTTV